MTEEDYIKLCQDRLGEEYGEKEAKYVLENCLHSFNNVLESFSPKNESVEDFNMHLKEMGYTGEFKFNE